MVEDFLEAVGHHDRDRADFLHGISRNVRIKQNKKNIKNKLIKKGD
jgi:hypothetical protein